MTEDSIDLLVPIFRLRQQSFVLNPSALGRSSVALLGTAVEPLVHRP